MIKRNLLASSFVFYLLAGCSINEKIDASLAQLSRDQQGRLDNLNEAIEKAPAQKISWNTAIQRIENSNLSYRASQDQVDEAIDNRKDQWLQLLPDLFTYVSISKGITELVNLSRDDISATVYASLVIPNPFRFYAQRYANELSILASQWQKELNRRRLYVQLYQGYIAQDRIKTRELLLRKKKAALSAVNLSKLANLMKEIKSEEFQIANDKEAQRVRLNQLFNSPGRRWQLVGSPPRISYQNKLHALKLGGRFGQLGLMMQTLEIERAHLSIQKVKFERWPQINFGLSAPPIYQSSGSGASFDVEQFRFFGGASERVSLTDPLDREGLENVTKRVAYTMERLLLTSEREVSRLHLLKKRYKQLSEIETILLEKMKYIDSKDQTQTQYDILISDINEQAKIQKRLEEVKMQKTAFDLELWIWDESYWKTYE